MSDEDGIELRVEPLDFFESEVGEARLHPTTTRELGVGRGDPIGVHGERAAAAVVREAEPSIEPGVIELSMESRTGAGANPPDTVRVSRARSVEAERLVLELPPEFDSSLQGFPDRTEAAEQLRGRALRTPQPLLVFAVRPDGPHSIPFKAVRSVPTGIVSIGERTTIEFPEAIRQYWAEGESLDQ